MVNRQTSDTIVNVNAVDAVDATGDTGAKIPLKLPFPLIAQIRTNPIVSITFTNPLLNGEGEWWES